MTSNELYTAKRKAAAVLGHRLRPGDLPSDAEVREQLVALRREPAESAPEADEQPEPEPDDQIGTLAETLDRFAIYKMRLAPLETVKQNPKQHPEGDALFHSLQVFHLARDLRPYDEEFLLAALLHDVGLAIDPQDHVAAGIAALRGSVTDRTLWLIEHQKDLTMRRDLDSRQGRRLAGSPPASSCAVEREITESEYADDWLLLRELDHAAVCRVNRWTRSHDVLDYLKGLEHESYLDE